MSEFIGKVAVVTGGASGIGRAVVRQLSDEGCRVYSLDIKAGENCSDHSFVVDVTDRNTVSDCIEIIVSRHGRLDYLVNCAGILFLENILESCDDHWARMFDVNFHAAVYICRTVAKQMKAQREGSIVLVSSNAAAVPRTNMAGYCASKAALSQFARCLALEMAPFGVRCNVVAPGSTLTNMQRQLWQGSAGEDAVLKGDLTQFRVGVPMGRVAEPEDIAQSVVFLLSRQSRHVTMESLTVDGGAALGCG